LRWKNVRKWSLLQNEDCHRIVTGARMPTYDEGEVFLFMKPTIIRDATVEIHPKNIQNREVHPKVVDAWCSNYEENKPYIKKGIIDLFDKYKGKTAIICGNGPSIEKTGPLVRKHKDAVVIATNGSLQHVKEADFLMCLDYKCKDWWFKDVTIDMPLISSVFSNPLLHKYFDDIYHFSLAPTPGVEQLVADNWKYGYLESGKSVVYSAFHLAYKMGCTKFIFVGCDGAYTNGHAHSGDNPERDIINIYNKVGIDGRYVMTEGMLQSICDNLSALAWFIQNRHKDYKVFNATGCGVMEQFMELIDIEKVYEEILT